MKMKDGEAVTADEIVKRIARYKGIFEVTGGGLTLSGGEVLMQPAFAANILHQTHEMGIHTTIDTSGFLGAACTDEMLDDIDLVLLDVKAGDEDTYKGDRAGLATHPGLWSTSGRCWKRNLDPIRSRPWADRLMGERGKSRRPRGELGNCEPS